MSAMARADAWDTDQNLLCERLADRLRAEGSPHPAAAAVALAVRGWLGCDRAEFATRHHLDLGVVEAIDAGAVPLADLPPPVLLAARHELGLDLDHLAALDAPPA